MLTQEAIEQRYIWEYTDTSNPITLQLAYFSDGWYSMSSQTQATITNQPISNGYEVFIEADVTGETGNGSEATHLLMYRGSTLWFTAQLPSNLPITEGLAYKCKIQINLLR